MESKIQNVNLPYRKKKFVVQIREVMDNKKFDNSVTAYVGSKDAKKIYKLLKDHGTL